LRREQVAGHDREWKIINTHSKSYMFGKTRAGLQRISTLPRLSFREAKFTA